MEIPPATTLTSFFATCTSDPFERTLLYSEMPRYYTWNASSKKWLRRKSGHPVDGYPGVFSTDALGRIYTIHPKDDDCLYLRLLLINVRGSTSFESLRTVDGTICTTFREACQQLQLLEHDSHWNQTLADAIASSPATAVRTLSTCQPSNPCLLWDTYKDDMAEDILHRLRLATRNVDLQMNADIYNEALVLIEDLCLLMSRKLLIEVHMPAPSCQTRDLVSRELERERAYDITHLQQQVQTNVPLLNEQQSCAYNQLINAVDSGNGGIFFLDVPGGTGKTFLLSLILAATRGQGGIALALASTGIAATLLEGGRLPLNSQIHEGPVCNISKQSAMAQVLKKCKLIIWDECTMAHKRSLEALDRTLRDLRYNNRCFGGVMILLAGDFRQTLPVIPKSTAADELNACLKSSHLWRFVKTISLTMNMRVLLQNDKTAEVFSKELLRIGNGQVPIDPCSGLISIPTTICQFTSNKYVLISSVYPNIAQNYGNYDWLSTRAILAAKNMDVNDLNWTIQNQIPGDLRSYKSIDRVENEDGVVNYPVEFLNSLMPPGMAPHNLRLKVGSVVIMLRNLHAPKVCNGTRLIVTKLMDSLIVARILKGPFKEEECLLPRIPLTSTDLPFQFIRLQFPVKLAFAMTINKSQGQSLEVCGINLEMSCFSHGQLYVACSRVGKPSSLFIYATEQKTKNIVYRAALN
ncbi:ATP-dependent DNA helicase PIF1-like [Zeugodacus cucurbitae]|uniref:ATP-dependent DNA helicase PIF1-like n=1 Tax=Zeugodacus cucurbitae TaxID=28588 RepID=UPI0023D9397D|nr:ATP-dependent DNA helicase PIF1-like [Zeugodacus cucurbitae]